MSDSQQPTAGQRVLIRDYQPADHDRVRWLYERGRLAGQVAPNDTAADIDNITEAYLDADRSHFWVAELEGEVVGTVGVAEDQPHQAQIRRLRVHPDHRDIGIAYKLMEEALAFCHHHGYLKVTLDTAFEEGPAIEVFDRFAFQHDRTRNRGNKEVIEFYLDLYRKPKPKEEPE